MITEIGFIGCKRKNRGNDMSKFKGEEIIKIIDALNGSISPVGETNVDNQRYDNLKNLENIINCFLDDIQMLIPNRNSYEYSVQRIGNEAVEYLQRVRENINEWMQEYDVEER